MRRAFLAALVGLAASAALPALAQQTVLTGAARAQALTQASAALNAQRSVQGRFRQVAPDGTATTGRFYLQRPGRVRFEYDAPSQLLIVSDGQTVAIHDRALRSLDRAPLRQTPLYFVLKNNINLDRDARVTRVARDGGALFVSVRDRTGEADGEITLRLEGANMTLRSWEVVDATGSRTRVALTSVDSGGAIDPRLFRTPRPGALNTTAPAR
ncbi:MAG: outer membrane lipoprotein carrier protein LolA [Hyphomonadaceae bacterium]